MVVFFFLCAITIAIAHAHTRKHSTTARDSRESFAYALDDAHFIYVRCFKISTTIFIPEPMVVLPHTCAISIQHCRVMGILYANCGFFTVGLVVVTGGVVGRADKNTYQARKRLD